MRQEATLLSVTRRGSECIHPLCVLYSLIRLQYVDYDGLAHPPPLKSAPGICTPI